MPLFPTEIADAMRERDALAVPEAERPGVMGPINTAYCWIAGEPAALIEVAFFPQSDLPEMLQPSNWDRLRRGAQWPLLEQLFAEAAEASAGYVLEFGPTLVLRNREIPFETVLPAPPSEWEEAVHERGSALVVIGSGLAVARTGEGGLVAPVEAAGLKARDGGAYPAPQLTEIQGLKVTPLTVREYDESRPYSFILDTDVVIGIERFLLNPRPDRETARIRQLLVNLAYRDVLPGPALSQLYQHGRTGFNTARAERAAAALREIMEWDRARILAHSAPPVIASDATDNTFTPTSVDPRMMMLYAGMIRLRREWSPAATLGARAQAFERFLAWVQNDLQISAPFLIQVALNLLVADEDTHRQASHLLRFRNTPVTAKTLDELWATAFDVYLISTHATMIAEPTLGEPVLLTFDRGVAGLYEMTRYVGMVPLPGDVSEDGGRWFVVGTKLSLHPRLEYLKPRVADWYEQARVDMLDRHAHGRDVLERGAEFEAIAEQEELLLLARSN